jgi:hypothetical protein
MMVFQSDDSSNQRDLIEVRGDGNALQQFLEIHPPDDASNTPPILTFKRKHEVEIPWGKIVGDEAVTSANFDVNEEWWKDSAGKLIKHGWMTKDS